VRTLGVDRPALPAYFAQKNIDLSKEPVEVTVGEIATVRAGALFRGSGVHIDADAASDVPGIFAAGDCSSMNAAVAGAAVMGHVAGRSAARYAQTQPRPEPLSKDEVERIHETLVRPLQKEEGLTFRQFEDEVREIVTHYIGYRREEKYLQDGLRRLQELRHREQELIAENYHGLMRVNEARNIRAVAEAIAFSAIERKETRASASHFRVDYPDTDDENGRRIILVKEGLEKQLVVTSRPTGLPSGVLAEIPADSSGEISYM
jgi:succinate dehydrogenase/fumarate reductase flavoprotein subunit